MNAVVALDELIRQRRIWRGKPAKLPASRQPTGWRKLDAALPAHGWPENGLIEVLPQADGVGELQLVLPTLARLTRDNHHVVVVAPPYPLHAPAWQTAGVDLSHLNIIEADAGNAAWAMEQCLRSGSCGAALGWLGQAGNRVLRRLEVAAGTGKALGFVFRDRQALRNPSPAAVRIDVTAGQLHVRKCRGGRAPAPFAFSPW